MAIGDTLVKLANQQPLTEDEKLQLRLWGNQGENVNSFVAGLQNGSSPITSRSIESQTGNFIIPPINASWFGWDVLLGGSFPQNLSASNTFTTYTGFTDYVLTNQSCMRWYDQTNGRIMLSPQFAYATPRIISLFGTAEWGSPCTSAQLNIYIKKKSDNSTINAVAVIRDTGSTDCGAFYHPFSVNFNMSSITEPPSNVYFEFQAKATYAVASCGIAIEVMFHRTL